MIPGAAADFPDDAGVVAVLRAALVARTSRQKRLLRASVVVLSGPLAAREEVPPPDQVSEACRAAPFEAGHSGARATSPTSCSDVTSLPSMTFEPRGRPGA